jgi:hypothetical protein
MPIAISIIGQTHVSGLTNLREGAPNTKAPVRRKLPAGAVVRVEGLVVGESVQGNAHWYRVMRLSRHPVRVHVDHHPHRVGDLGPRPPGRP